MHGTVVKLSKNDTGRMEFERIDDTLTANHKLLKGLDISLPPHRDER